jgi:hypothetical protein
VHDTLASHGRPESGTHLMNIKRALIVWFTMIPVAVANGALRQFVYGPLIGEPMVHQISCFTAIAAFGALIWIANRRWAFSSSSQAFDIGLLWAALTVAFEAGLGLTSGMHWRDIVADYALWNGHLWGLVVAFLVVAPVALVALRTQSRSFRRTARGPA